MFIIQLVPFIIWWRDLNFQNQYSNIVAMDDKFSVDVRYDDDGEYESTPGSSANGKIPTF